PRARLGLIATGMALLLLLTAVAPGDIPRHITVFVLAIVIGYYVIGNVHHALHTPLMSVTNAISGVIVVGALLQIGIDNTVGQVLATIAILVASINVFGGFAVTRRMLGMFSKGA
ncbi:proton-translocating transhydrogenase family protein, partial [Dietzia sp. SYD-A1]